MEIDEARKKAIKILREHPEVAELRSCWNCNPAHEHLKNHLLVNCYDCGHWYYNGLDITMPDEDIE